MTETRNLSRFASIANAAYNSITANATAITAISVGGVSINSTSYPGTANNATNLGGVAAASYVNTSGSYTLGGDITLNANLTIASTGELIIASGAGIQANGSFGATNQVLFSNGSSIFWANSSSISRQTFTATNGQTTFTVSGGYTPNQADVYYNGVKLINGTEVTVSSGTNVVLSSGAANGATIDVVASNMTTLTALNSVAKTGDTMTGVLNLPSNGLTIGTAQLVVTGGNIGIGTGSPSARLDVVGNTVVNGTIFDSKGDVRTLVVNPQTTSYTLVANDHGQLVSTNTTVIIPASVFTAGQNISIYNNSSSSVTINTTSAGVTCFLAGSANTSSRTLAQRGIATVVCVAANNFVISGAGLT